MCIGRCNNLHPHTIKLIKPVSNYDSEIPDPGILKSQNLEILQVNISKVTLIFQDFTVFILWTL